MNSLVRLAHRIGENGVSLEGLAEVNLPAQLLLTVMTAKKRVAVLVDMVKGGQKGQMRQQAI